MMTVIIFVVDAFAPKCHKAIVVHNINDGRKELKDFASERIIYEGDQVWRIHKENRSVGELVERYDEYGCT